VPEGAVAIRYRQVPPGPPRPYLVLHVTGPNGRSGPSLGIVDSGADTASFPFGYASLMGYTSATLVPETFGQAGGAAQGYRATVPCTAIVPEVPAVQIEMHPLFIQGSQWILWGRLDLMTKFDVLIQEAEKRFILTPRS
jgi:hypothetical protein